MDLDLLTLVSRMHDPVTKCVRGINGDCLIKIMPEEIREVFGMDPFSEYNEAIDFWEL